MTTVQGKRAAAALLEEWVFCDALYDQTGGRAPGTGSAEESLASYPELCESQSLLRSQVSTDEWLVSFDWWTCNSETRMPPCLHLNSCW